MNREIKETIDYLKAHEGNLAFRINELLKYFDELQIEKEDYKSRCEKAIEYIENNKKETSSHFNGKEYVYRNFTLCCEPNDLLNILKGSGVNE